MSCKNQEKISELTPKIDMSPCAQLTQDTPADVLLFVAKGESNRKKVAAQEAENKAMILLVQFFQDEFIEGGQWGITPKICPEPELQMRRSKRIGRK